MSTSVTKNLLNGRLISIIFLGFASGLPFTLTASTLQAWFTEAHVDLMTIGFLSLLGIPYTLKFLWAPLMDYFSLPLGKRRGWMIVTQLCLAVLLLVIAHMNPATQASTMGMVALAIAFFSASQDVSIDAYRADVLTPTERGLGASYFVFAYRVAGLLSGGLALVFAEYLGWTFTYNLMAALMLLSMLVSYFSPRVVEYEHTQHSMWQMVIASVQDFMQRDKMLILFLFIIFYKLGDALAISLMSNFLLHGLGFSLAQVGLAYKSVSFVAITLGGFLGGVLLLRWSIYRALLVFGLAQAFSNLMFVLLAVVGKQFTVMVASILIENFCSGLSTAALLAFLMSLCNHRYTATQFALLSAIASLGRVFLGPLAAYLVQNVGWVDFYLLSFVLSMPGILFLKLLKPEVSSYAHNVSH